MTAFVGDINFQKPIPVGDLVELKARVIHTGRSSMHIAVDVYSCNPKDCQSRRAIRCIMIFVAVDDKGRTVEVPTWTPTTAAEERMAEYAVRIKKLRKVNQTEMDAL